MTGSRKLSIAAIVLSLASVAVNYWNLKRAEYWAARSEASRDRAIAAWARVQELAK